MQSHSDGEVWGLSVLNDDYVLKTGDDNQVLAWSTIQRKCISNAIVSSTARSLYRRGASSLTLFPDSQCARAISFNKCNCHVAVEHNDGTMTIRAGVKKLDEVILPKTTQRSGSNVFSTHLMKLCSLAALMITSLTSMMQIAILLIDWSIDCSYIRSVCGAHELLFFKSFDDKFSQDTAGASSITSTEWATNLPNLAGSSKVCSLREQMAPT